MATKYGPTPGDLVWRLVDTLQLLLAAPALTKEEAPWLDT